jgi:hypothetical protein
MDDRVRTLETEVAVLGSRQTTSEVSIGKNATDLSKLDEKIDVIHVRISHIDRRLSRMQGQMMVGLGGLQILLAYIFN